MTVKSVFFPAASKLANITPVFKKGSEESKENFRPASLLPNVSKIFEYLTPTNMFHGLLSTRPYMSYFEGQN